MDTLLKYRQAAIQWAAGKYISNPLPTQPNANTFFYDNEVWLVRSFAENETWNSKLGINHISTFRQFWQYVGLFSGMVVYRLIPWRS
jgi:hypothetical protein